MAFRTSLRLCHLGWEPATVVVVEPWGMEYPVPAGEACEVVAVHPELVPTFTAGMADEKLVVRVNESGSTFEFWRAGRLYDQMPVPAPAGDPGPHGRATPAVRTTPLVPIMPYSISAPVHIVEESPGHVVLRSRPSTVRTWGYIRALLLILLLVSLAAIAFFAFIQVQLGGGLAAIIVAVIAAGSIGTTAVVVFTQMRKVHRWAQESVVHFDRNANVLRFVCPPSEPETRTLSVIAALQLLPTTARVVRSQVGTPSGGLVNWILSRFKQYQLNLVFADGSRLNLTFLEKRREVEELAGQLAEFLRVPVVGPATA